MRWQLPMVWLVGSLVTGTIAAVLAPGDGVMPLVTLSRQQLFTLVVLVGALFIGLFAIGWRTIGATWLRWQDTRSVILCASLVGGAGLGGWGYAAVVTFDAGFSPTTQLVPAVRRSRCGGLPFALVAGMLARPVRVNIAAVVVTIIAVLSGLAIMDAPLPAVAWFLVGFTPS